jgi:hypothetical protein
MATVIETVERDGKTIHVYDTGLERDAATGYIIKPAPHTIITDTEKSTALHRERLEQKRQRLAAGAARTLERTGEWEMPSDLDVVEAIGEAVMLKALDPKNAKQVDAARFIMDEAGFSERQARNMDESPVNAVRELLSGLAALAGSVSQIRDTQVTRTDILISDNDAHSIDDGEAGSSPTEQDQGTP